MKRHRSMSQIKEQEEKNTVRNLSKTDTSNMPDREFKVMIIYLLDFRKEWRTSVRPLTNTQKTASPR